MKIAVTMTCFNRVEKTIRLLTSLFADLPADCDLRVFMVDDGSSDDTAGEVGKLNMPIDVIQGTGSLYWSGGMRLASASALAWEPDFLIWINNDLNLFDGVLSRVCELARLGAFDREVGVGNVVSPNDSSVVYGGRFQSGSNPVSFTLCSESDYGTRVETFNGNFVIFGADLYRQLGGFPDRYRHAYSDLVMGLRASRAGFGVRTLAFPAGEDAGNPGTGTMFDARTPALVRIRFALSVFGLPPADHLRFCVEVSGPISGMIVFIRSYIRVIYPRVLLTADQK
ncbi:glycosyltransferase family 2 protein [Cryobacterium zhongshanensis]|uniref:Glycosyltransferase n=1 Tax=Cryobacterium zhongshanensis TaxID=2928153 RepID=A0AA41UKT0_9MICO|nr:glycosyltransferase [Cryobacterium zhongshanensis]MCI4658236.1 glycosyltransferase [Cryobacterium zhongshanensis]